MLSGRLYQKPSKRVAEQVISDTPVAVTDNHRDVAAIGRVRAHVDDQIPVLRIDPSAAKPVPTARAKPYETFQIKSGGDWNWKP